ncbi:unnamed protein product [Dracunculus medinensis]|uniref:FHA domain-containing protein n=1 Tax=Dracunculus medinensis TaxID=318479 RepID=A0A0N4UR46_DRAME|nr:unnamed protein product [Dracunculus medinensis]
MKLECSGSLDFLFYPFIGYICIVHYSSLSAEDLSSFGTGYNGGPFKIVKQRNLKVGDILQFGRNYLIINELRPSTSNADEVFEDDVAEAPSNSYSVQNIFEKKKFNIRSVSNKNEKAKLFLLSSDDEDDDIIDQSSSTIFAFDTLRQSLKSQYYRKVSDNIDHTKWISSNYPTGVVSESCVVKDDTVHNQADDRFVVKSVFKFKLNA